MRINTLISIAKYVSSIESSDIYIEQTIYSNLQQLFKQAAGSPWNRHA